MDELFQLILFKVLHAIKFPETCKLALGVIVPIPTLPHVFIAKYS